MKLLIANARIILADHILENGYLLCEDGVIAALGPMGRVPPAAGARTIDAAGRYLSPGFIDLHVHGGAGADFRDGDEDAYVTALRAHLRGGTTTILPTLSSDSLPGTQRSLDCYGRLSARRTASDRLPHLAGVHLEGPYFSPAQKGAQNGESLRDPTAAEYEALYARAPFIKKWSVACELPGALEMARRMSRRGVVMSVGHSDADYGQVVEAFEHGFRCVTHLYSSCSMVHRVGPYRHGGVVEAAFLLDGMDVEVIADGRHLPPELLRLIYRIKGPDRIALVTDCIRPGAMEAPDAAAYDNKEKTRPLLIENGVAILLDRTSFAGSIATTSQLVRTMLQDARVGLTEAVQMAAATPARMLGLDHVTGSLAVGKRADMLLFDAAIAVSEVIVAGIPQLQE